MPEFAPVLNVSSLNGANGYRLDGDAPSDLSGRSVAGGGDVDGDGFADVLIGSLSPGTGAAWVVFGAAANPAAQSLSSRVSAGTAYQFLGEAAGDRAGYSVSNAGDVNGDGFDDLLIGAHYADPDVADGNRGATYLVFGGAAHLEALDQLFFGDDNRIALFTLDPEHAFRFDGVATNDYAGLSVSGAGDIDGDGIDDLVIGAPNADTLGGTGNGATYVVFGGGGNLGDLDDDDVEGADGRIDLAQISAGQGMRIDGARINGIDNSGRSVAAAGDVNGDGFDDVILGAPFADGSRGAAYIVFGQARSELPANLDLAIPNGLTATRLDGVAQNDFAGAAVSGLGDVNGDGFDDVLIGAYGADPNGTSFAGSAYVVFGKSGWGASLDLASLYGADGFRLNGLRVNDWAGRAVSGAGDVNGDGLQDLLIGAPNSDRVGAGNSGAAYVVFGRAAGFSLVIDLGRLGGNDGFRIDGFAANDQLGFAVEAAGDVNGDGFDDLVAGAPYADNGGANSGSSYIVYGHRAQSAVTRVGTERADRINGGVGADTVSGLDGNDILLGWEDDDIVAGGAGNDVANGDAGDDLIQGAGGNDRLDGGADDDRLEGGSGNDRFVASAGDEMMLGGSGSDVLDFASFAIAVVANLATGLASFSTGSASFNSIAALTGGAAADNVTGNAAVNTLLGQGGNDRLDGAAGDDRLTGALGRDVLTGGAGRDVFDYNVMAETGIAAATRDIVTDFVHLTDRIDLASIDAIVGGGLANDAFAFQGTLAFTAAGQIRLQQAGASTIVEINTSGASAAEASIQLTGVTASTLTAADFVL